MKRLQRYRSLLFGLFIFPQLAAAQLPTDAVHLLSGQTQEGIIIEQRPGVSIRLWRLLQGDTLTFAMEEIERITRILPAMQSPVPANPPLSAPAAAAYNPHRNFVMVQGLIGGGDYPFGGLGLELGRRLGRQGKTWLGFSAQYIGNTSTGRGGVMVDDIQNFPLLIDWRQEFRRSQNGRSSTMIFVDAGYVVSITGNTIDQYGELEYGNGFAFHPGVAFRVNLTRNVGLMLDIGWMHHTGSRHWLPPSTQPDDVKAWNNVLLRGNLFF